MTFRIADTSMWTPASAALLAAAMAVCAFAQSFSSNLSGTVSDQEGAAVPLAAVTLTNDATGDVRKGQTDGTGRFTFSRLLPSNYSLKVAAPGFQEYQLNGFALTTNQSLEVNPQLTLGAMVQSVEVSGKVGLVDTQTANRSMTLTKDMVSELPLNLRNPLALVFASAGVVAARTGVSQAVQDQNWNRFSLNGGRHESTAVLVDGTPMGAGDWGGLIASPGTEAVQEVQVVRNTYDAEFGRTGGGVINITSKGGGPQYHGGVFDFYRNDNLDANSFFNNRAGVRRTESKRNQFGGAIGGPILKSRRVFGFAAYEGLRTGSPVSQLSTVPTELQRKGDFSQTRNANGSLSVVYDPMSTVANPASSGKFIRTPFAGNVIPAQRFDPVGVKVLALYPNANQTGSVVTGANNWYGAGSSTTHTSHTDARVDWARSDKHSMFARFTIGRQLTTPFSFFGGAGDTSNFDKNPRYQISLGNTFVLSPTFIVNAQLGGGRWAEITYGRGQGYDATALGFSKALASQFDVAAPPTFSIGDYSALGYGRDLNGVREVFSAQINATKELGSHSVKFGWSWQSSRMNFKDSNSPSFSFSRLFTSGPDPDARLATAGNSVASLLLGTGSGGSFPLRLQPASTDAYHGFYAQDAWRVTRRLTFNYGLRYDIQKGRTERFNRYSQIDLNVLNPIGPQVGLPQLKGGLVFMTPDNRQQWNTPYRDFAPRVGLAYKVTDRLVARTGYGIYFDRATYAGPLTGTAGYAVSTPWVPTLDGGRTPYNLLKDPYPDGILPLTGSSGGVATNVGLSLSGMLRDRPTPYIQQFSFDLQYQIGSTMMMEAGYTGTLGRKLMYGYGLEFNQMPDQYRALGSALLDQVANPFFGVITTGSLAGRTVQRGQLLRPYPQYTGVAGTMQPGATSSYNALVTRFVKRFANSLTFDLSYQFSKALDNCSESGSPGLVDAARNYNDLSLDKSVSSHDAPHSLAVALVHQLPLGRGRAIGGSWPKWMDAAFGGWSISGIYRLASGQPSHFTITNNTYSFGGNQQPNVSDMRDVPIANRSSAAWFNKAAFSKPADYTYGNAPRWLTNVRFDRFNNLDASVGKTFKAGDRVKIQLRGEFFNAFNRNQFGWPNTSFDSNTFGENNGGAPGARPRNVQIGLRVNF